MGNGLWTNMVSRSKTAILRREEIETPEVYEQVKDFVNNVLYLRCRTTGQNPPCTYEVFKSNHITYIRWKIKDMEITHEVNPFPTLREELNKIEYYSALKREDEDLHELTSKIRRNKFKHPFSHTDINLLDWK